MSKPSGEPGEEDFNAPQAEDIEGLQQQFEQQQSMIAQLKGALQSSKQQFASKEKQMEEYAAKLSNIKSRTKASKHSSKTSDVKRTSDEGIGKERKEQLEGTSKQNVSEIPVQEEVAEMSGEKEKKDIKKSGKNTEKSRLLRKKLEENRMRFEQRGKEISENKKGIEEMVENLRMQLEERDQVIQTLQRGLESSPGTLSVVAIKEHDAEVVNVSSDINVGEQADQREMYAQIVYKDNKIVELNNRIMELELNVLDLQENLKEKDAVIDARTKAITLMSEDMSRKSKTTLDTLDDTREQMRLMQNNFITLEARMKDESEQLKKQLEEKERKLKYVEESHKKLESVRFELTTTIAELQEKVVHLQTFNSALQKQVEEKGKDRQSKGEKQDRVEELMKALDESNRQVLKAKAQHKNKVKSLTKQIESLKKVSESSDEILRLQQRVAELEEDKAAEQSWKERIHELEDRVKLQNQDLDSHIRALSHLEAEKLNLIEDLQSERLQVSELGSELSRLKSRISELENLKVTAEMKAVELEELVDIITQEKNALLQENKTLSDDKNEYKQLLDTLQQEKDTLQQEKVELLEEISTLQTLVKENNPADTDSNRSEFQMVSSNNSDEEKWKRLPTPEENLSEEKHLKDSSNVELYVKLLESELEDARRVISEEKDNILDLKFKLEAREEEIEMHLEVISKLEQLGREVGSLDDHAGDVNKISEILKELNEMTGDLEEWKNRCTEVEDRLKSLEDEKTSLESKLEEVTNENSLLSAQLNLQKQVSEELASKLKERNKVISEKDDIIQEFEHKVAEEQKEKEMFDLPDTQKSGERDGSNQQEVISLREELENLRKVCLGYEKEIAAKDADISQLKVELEEKQKKIINLQENVGVFDESSNSHLQDELKQKEMLLGELKNECKELRNNLEELKSNVQSGSGVEFTSEYSSKVQEMDLIHKGHFTLLSEKESELEEAKQKSISLTAEIRNIDVNLKAETLVFQNIEEIEKKYLDDIQEKDEIISKFNFEKETLCGEIELWKQQCDEKDRSIASLTEKIESDLQLRDSKIKELMSQNRELISMNENLTRDLGTLSQKLIVESNHAEEKTRVLTNRISELEKEMSTLRSHLCNRIEESEFLKSECSKIPELLEDKEVLERCKAQNEKKNQELITEIMKKEDELADISSKFDDLSNTVEIKNHLLETCSTKCRDLEQIIVTKDMQVTALEDRISAFENSWLALEAKLQERDAVIESLEHDLANSNSRQQHLEEGLSFIEDRRRSLENKFAALGEQLQESDRIKEEAEEHEGELEYRLAALASSEDNLRKRIESLNEKNVELSQKISELSLQNEDLKRNVVNADNNFKIANKEIERLAGCESAHLQALESIERLEADLKKRSAEFERSYKEKEEQTRQYIETVELDMKNLNLQLEVSDNEKRSLMERCENLNDIKMNLEDDIGTLQEKTDFYQSKILELEKMNSERDFEMKSVVVEKQKEVEVLKEKVEILEENLHKVIIFRDTNSITTQTEENPDNNNDIQLLKFEIETKTKLLAQRESEIKSYQNRLLQLQFGQDGSKSKMSDETDLMRRELENSVAAMQEELSLKDSQLKELKILLNAANSDIDNMRLQLANSCQKIQEMSYEIGQLKEMVQHKDNQMQERTEQISSVLKFNKITQQPDDDKIEYESQIIAFQNQISQLHQELIWEKANNVVSDVVSSAQLYVHKSKNIQKEKLPLPTSEQNKVQFHEQISCVVLPDNSFKEREKAIHSNDHIHKISTNADSIYVPGQSQVTFDDETDLSCDRDKMSNNRQELVEKLGDLRAELDFIKIEYTQAVMKMEELQLEVNRLHDVEKQLKIVQSRHQMFVSNQGSSEMGNIEQYSKESSVESEFTSEKESYKDIPTENEKEMQLLRAKELLQDNVHSCSDVLHELASSPNLIDLAEASWTVDITEGGEDGWEWGTEDARLEEEHLERQKAALMTSSLDNDLQQQVEDLENKIDLLEKEKNKITEELRASQIRSGKILKKLKDLKIKNESLMRENQKLALKKSNEFGSLDLAIEEELKIRIDALEKELKECKCERDAVNSEKEGLQKQVEILSAANERLSEREQHGVDIEFWQNKTKELNNQIETLQWRIEELMEERETEKSENKALNLEELQEQMTALAADNEQLQIMLEEQRNLRVGAEAALKDLQQYTSSKEANFLQDADIKEHYMILRENYDLLCKELSTLRSHPDHDILIAENTALRENYEILSTELQQLHSSSSTDLITAEYSSMQKNYESMCNELEELRSRVDDNNTLQANYESLQMTHDKLINEMKHMQRDYCSLTEKYEVIAKEKVALQDECYEKSKIMREKFELINQLERDKMELATKYETLSFDVSVMSSELQYLKDEVEKYTSIVEEMTQEQERLNKENLELKEKYKSLKSLNQQLSDTSVDEPKAKLVLTEEAFLPIQLFSKVDKETFIDVAKSSIATQIQDKSDGNDLEKEIMEYKIKIVELQEIKQQKIDELRVLRDMFSNEQEEWGNIEQNMSKKIEILERELEMKQEATKRESEIRESLMLKEHELSNLKSQISAFEETLIKTQYKVEDLEAQLLQKEEEFQDVNRNSENQENMFQQIIASKGQEVNTVNEKLAKIQQEQEELLLTKENDIENLRLQISDREIEIENLLELKDKDLHNLKIQMSEIEQKALEDKEEKDNKIQNLESQLAQSKSQVENMSQELKEKEQLIISLQEDLEAREDEIREAVLQIRDRNIEIQQLKQSGGGAAAFSNASTSPRTSDTRRDSESQSDSSQQNELDLALYMLHQRDVRCEELTLELMQLLEERDTLQLRLSTAIRINEELRSKMSKTSNPTSPLRVSTTQTDLELPNSSDVVDASERILAPIDPEPITNLTVEEPTEDLKVLADKLSQLHSVDYRRDVTLQDEREQRHSEQVMLLHPRASGALVESNYTLSRDVQSPSTVLLNWIWGRSTPKVMHI